MDIEHYVLQHCDNHVACLSLSLYTIHDQLMIPFNDSIHPTTLPQPCIILTVLFSIKTQFTFSTQFTFAFPFLTAS